jgi:hypothetical protein
VIRYTTLVNTGRCTSTSKLAIQQFPSLLYLISTIRCTTSSFPDDQEVRTSSNCNPSNCDIMRDFHQPSKLSCGHGGGFVGVIVADGKGVEGDERTQPLCG